MFAQVIWFPETASSTAGRVDRLFIFLLSTTGAVGLLVAFLLIYFAVRYRRRPGDGPPPNTQASVALETFWTVTPLGIFLVMFAWGASVYIDAVRPPDDAQTVYVVAKQWMWKFQHPEGQREINQLHVPRGQSVKLLQISEDVIHSFFVRDFRLHMDVLPGRYSSVWFQPTKTGTYPLFCSQYCGTNHAGMIGEVIVMEPAEYQDWLNSHAEGSLALEGRKLFLQYRCISCHTATGEGRAPSLEELYGKRVPLKDGRNVIADDAYIRESILDPGAKIVAGYENIMPTFRGQLGEEDILKLIAFIRNLQRGQTPPRVEESPAPVTTPPIKTPAEQP
jgi:cytochrome c oxidase subunit 2